MDYVNNYYSRVTYGVCYGHKVTSINGMDMWPPIEFEDIRPPKYKKGLSRPKKLRKREPDEDPNKTRLRRDLVPYKCTRCRATGHNSRRCPLLPLVVPEEQNPEPSRAQGATQGVAQGANQGASEVEGATQGVAQDANQGAREGEGVTQGVAQGANQGAGEGDGPPVGGQTQEVNIVEGTLAGV